MANDIIGIVVTDNSDNVQINATPNLVSINVTNTSGNIIGYNYYLASTFGALPAIGENTVLYVVSATSLMYRWNGSAYVQINSIGSINWGNINGTLSNQTDLQNALNLKAPLASPTFTGTVSGITKAMVGLGNVDNTTDANKPISTATQTALNLKYDATNPSGYITGITSGNVTTALGYTPVTNARTITINGTALDLSANRSYSVGTVTSVGALTLGTSGTDVSSTIANGTTTPAITLNIPTASANNRGALSSTDWTTFNNKANALSGTTNTIPKFTSASAIGNSNITDSGSLISLGSNINISSGSLGIATTDLTGYNLRINKNLTGSTSPVSLRNEGTIQSDATSSAAYYQSVATTAASAFTLGTLTHYESGQSTIGAGSTVTLQVGFNADSSLIGAVTNLGFRGRINSGTNRWNLYMSGTAANYLEGDTAIGTTSLATATKFTLGGSETASSAIARGGLINTTLVASANSDVLVGLDIAPTFTNGAFTGVGNFGLRVQASSNFTQLIRVTGPSTSQDAYYGNDRIDVYGSADYSIKANNGSLTISTATTGIILFRTNNTERARFFNNGNFTLQNGGTFTDAGFRLDVAGTTRFQGTTASDTAPLGSELAGVTGTGTNWALASGATNLNVGGYIHTVGDVTPLTTSLAAVNGTYYQIAYTITGRTAGSITIAYGGTSTAGITATGTTGPRAISTAVLTITPTTDFDGTVVLSIKSIGTSSASSTFANSGGGAVIQLRAGNILSNTFIGGQSGSRNTTGNLNTFFGQDAGTNNTTGNANTFTGQGAGFTNTTGFNNCFFGTSTGLNNTSGFNNTFSGTSSGLNNTTGNNNCFFGTSAGSGNTIGNNNTFIGLSSGQSNTIGIDNIAIGSTSGFNNTTGSSNIFLGRNSGRFIANGSTPNLITNNSIYIGATSKAFADNQTNQIVIGHDATGLGSNTTVLGNSSTVTSAIYGNLLLGSTTTTGNRLQVTGTSYFNGNVGIGITSPASTLHLAAEDSPIITFTRNNNADSPRGGINFYALSNLKWQIGTNLISFTTGFEFNYSGSNVGLIATSGNWLIGTTSDIASSKLTINSTTQGVLFPRMTTTEKNAISSPATGLVVFDTTLGKLCVFSTTWQTITSI